MPRLPAVLALSLLAVWCQPSPAMAQTSALSSDALKSILLKRGDDMMTAWKKHDRAGIAATFAPDFVNVRGDTMAADAEATIKVLMSCDLAGYRIAESAVKPISPTAAVLITRQEQQITCFGHPAPPVMNMTDTYVKRNGVWLILVHIEAAP